VLKIVFVGPAGPYMNINKVTQSLKIKVTQSLKIKSSKNCLLLVKGLHRSFSLNRHNFTLFLL